MCLNPVTLYRANYETGETMQVVPCGKCLECQQMYSLEWAHRICDEASLHSSNCFVTLTYNDEHLPADGVNKRDLQLFIKSLRDLLDPVRIRYFACGEYGSINSRPHYHLIIFGWQPLDLFALKCRDNLYRSPTVEKLWKCGYSSVGAVNLDTALYCAKYLNKVNPPPRGQNKPFTLMSLKPGIGFGVIDPKTILCDRIYHNGKGVKLPRYYLKVLEREGYDLTELKNHRCLLGSIKAETKDIEKARKRANELRAQYRRLKFYRKKIEKPIDNNN